uniref:Uncharacterized protein n=1 Tax=Solanum lycopersicum TaxID=4081 RepID=A0A494G8C1_SOLLC
MTSPPMDSTHGRTMSCHTRSNDVGGGMPSLPLDSTHGRMTSGVAPSSPLCSTNSRTTSCMACHNRLWTSSHSRTASGVGCHHRPLTKNAVERRWAWHAIIAFGQHTRSNDVGRVITSPPLDSKHGRTTTYGRQRQAWHDITTVAQHTRSDESSVE